MFSLSKTAMKQRNEARYDRVRYDRQFKIYVIEFDYYLNHYFIYRKSEGKNLVADKIVIWRFDAGN
jgi:hypothetical protein